ncbi:hypothetical protein ROE7235_00429 [Roseibaca ekhonensis]|uniref:Peptidoglycan binding-like domain-containing protein n=1 Tax=Roseinatronobacter ekhonensis TaxID=254356 RepID=A0A3B0M4I2_9RHOB|nr:peptidoglycan-binding domain-containing protein [Roseibaca ekhonensis]SUZ30703.1 hypothetical protein ROE7235_00429 [Roseibaca ekhonensis]
MRRFFLAVFLLTAPIQAYAENVALVIEGRDYRGLPEPSGSALADQAQGVLARRGFEVVTARDLPMGDLRAELAALQAKLADGALERLVIVASGWFAASDSGAWFLASDASQPSLATVDGAGLRLDSVMELAANAASAHVWLAQPTSGAVSDELGFGLRAGLPDRLAVPRGVAVLRGDVRAVLDGLDTVLQPGTTLSETLAATRDLRGEGTVPTLVPFLPEGFAPVAQADRDAWETARNADTEDAYRSYLAQFPNGLSAQEARGRIDTLRNTPERIEQDLALSRNERRAIQRDLTTLGYNTRGIDGLFGPGTRGAIEAWQSQLDFTETGFLTRDQIFQLAGQAARRAAEIEAEERARREALERADRAFWEGTGAGADEAGLRAYLARYPEGIFAGLARERLATIEAEARAQADRAAWERARAADRARGYRRYLADFPDGRFVSQARRRLAELEPIRDVPAPDTPPPHVLEQEEAQLGMTQSVRVLVERRLSGLGYDPGMIDGDFDGNTRAAIKKAQARFGLPVNGYVSQGLLDSMLQDALRGLFR